MFTDWERSIRLLVAKFRADSARHIGDPSFEELIQALRQSSPEFCKAWKRHEVARTRRGPQGAAATRSRDCWCSSTRCSTPSRRPEQRLILYTPVPESDTLAKLERLLEDEPFHSPLALVG